MYIEQINQSTQY